MSAIDADKSGSISRYEWIMNFCSTDKNGKMVFRSNLRTLFEKYDIDNSGSLTLDELRELTKEAFSGYLKRAKDEEAKMNLEMMINQLAKEVLQELDDNQGKSISWDEFKDYMEIALGKQDKLKKFLDMNFE